MTESDAISWLPPIAIIPVPWVTVMEIVHLSPCLLGVFKEKTQRGKNKESNMGIWESPGNAEAHCAQLFALPEGAQRCRAHSGLKGSTPMMETWCTSIVRETAPLPALGN